MPEIEVLARRSTSPFFSSVNGTCPFQTIRDVSARSVINTGVIAISNSQTTSRAKRDTHHFMSKQASNPSPPLTSRVLNARAVVPGCCPLSWLCLTKICLASLATIQCSRHAGLIVCSGVDTQVNRWNILCFQSENDHTAIGNGCPGHVLYKFTPIQIHPQRLLQRY